MNNKFVISGFVDEASEALDVQIDVMKKLGMKYIEPRLVDGKNIIKLSDEELDNLKKVLDENGFAASSIGSPIGKIKTTDDFDAHFEEFKRAVYAAKKLGTKYIRMFSFFVDEDKTEENRDYIIEKLSVMVKFAEENGVVLLHENEKGIYGNIAPRCKDLFESIKSDSFRAVFDFSNFVECEQETMEAYEMLKPYIEYVHVKDCKWGGGVVPPGDGDGKLEAIFTKLSESGYNGFVSLEPHLFTFEIPEDAGELVLSFPDKKQQRFAYAHKTLCEMLERI